MVDLEQIATWRKRRLEIRAVIRAQNNRQPRCSGCGCDMLVHHDQIDLITSEILEDPDYTYLLNEDLRPGDLICFWCVTRMANKEKLYTEGHA